MLARSSRGLGDPGVAIPNGFVGNWLPPSSYGSLISSPINLTKQDWTVAGPVNMGQPAYWNWATTKGQQIGQDFWPWDTLLQLVVNGQPIGTCMPLGNGTPGHFSFGDWSISSPASGNQLNHPLVKCLTNQSVGPSPKVVIPSPTTVPGSVAPPVVTTPTPLPKPPVSVSPSPQTGSTGSSVVTNPQGGQVTAPPVGSTPSTLGIPIDFGVPPITVGGTSISSSTLLLGGAALLLLLLIKG